MNDLLPGNVESPMGRLLSPGINRCSSDIRLAEIIFAEIQLICSEFLAFVDKYSSVYRLSVDLMAE